MFLYICLKLDKTKNIMRIIRLLFGFVLASVWMLCGSSCGSDNESDEGTPEPGGSEKAVYVAGYENINGKKVATLWKNGEAIRLSNGDSQAEAYSIAVSGKDVYVAGYAVFGNSRIAVLWKNGVIMPLSYKNSEANSVFIQGNDIHVAGQEYESKFVATHWKNGTTTHLADKLSYGESVYASGNDVYVAGISSNNVRAALWKNGTPMTLTHPNGTTDGQMYSVCVSRKDVYVAGSAYIANNNTNIAVYWKNGTPIVLGGTYAEAKDICVKDNNIYVAGYDTHTPGRLKAMLWKNGEAISLTDGKDSAEARGLYVQGSKTYVVGYKQINAKYNAAAFWEDGNETLLTDGATEAEAFAVFVVE